MKSNGGVHRPQRTRSGKIHHHNHLEQVADAALRPPTIPISRLAVQCMFCFISLLLGFRFTREASQLFEANILQHGTSSSSSSYTLSRTFNFSTNSRSVIRSNLAWHISQTLGNRSGLFGTFVHSLPQQEPDPTILPERATSVWRHEILIRPWPHPDPLDVVQAYGLISRIQLEQRRVHGIKDWKPIIAITPTFVRPFQALHLTGLLHTLSLVPGPVIWIVIEAGGVSNETASLLTQAHVHSLVHLGLEKSMIPPGAFKEQEQQDLLETRLRIEGLRYVWEHKLEGIVVFADESNVHSLQFFDTVQEVNWVGVVSVGMLGHASFGSELTAMEERSLSINAAAAAADDDILDSQKKKYESEHHGRRMHQILNTHGSTLQSKFHEPQVQGPVCDSTGNLVGLHTFDNFSLDHSQLVVFTREEEEATASPRPPKSHKRRRSNSLEWAGFVLNANAIWEAGGGSEQPAGWLNTWLNWTVSSHKDNNSKFPDIRAILSDDAKKVKVLGGCGRQVLLWWARMEAHADGNYKFSKWTLDSPLEMVLPAATSSSKSSTPSPPAMPSSNSSNSSSGTREEWASHSLVPTPSAGGYVMGA